MRRMKFRNEAAWDATVEKNRGGGGAGIIAFCERWAVLMEDRIAGGEALRDCAKETCDAADADGALSGAAYSEAVGLLAAVWVHGDALRRWHNSEAGTKEEAAQADAEGAVISVHSYGIIPGR